MNCDQFLCLDKVVVAVAPMVTAVLSSQSKAAREYFVSRFVRSISYSLLTTVLVLTMFSLEDVQLDIQFHIFTLSAKTVLILFAFICLLCVALYQLINDYDDENGKRRFSLIVLLFFNTTIALGAVLLIDNCEFLSVVGG